jgi:hypothetical protein
VPHGNLPSGDGLISNEMQLVLNIGCLYDVDEIERRGTERDFVND